MRYLVFILLFSIKVNSQTFKGNNQYVIVIIDDSVKIAQYLPKKVNLTTNANKVNKCKAFEVDTINVLDSISKYKVGLEKFPENGKVNKNEIYIYKNKPLKVKKTHIVDYSNPEKSDNIDILKNKFFKNEL